MPSVEERLRYWRDRALKAEALSTGPAPAARSSAVKVKAVLELVQYHVTDDDDRATLTMAISALEPAEPATDVEAVAWLMNGKGENWEERNVVTFDKETADMKAATEWWTVEPLYKSRPPESRLREALEFYADSENWKQNGPLDPNSGNFTGGPARAALAQGADDE